MTRIFRRSAFAGLFLIGSLASAQTATSVVLRAGHTIPLMTVGELSSKTQAVGNLVPLKTAEDVIVDQKLVIPKGAEATGLIESMQKKGGLGQRGKLKLRPLFLTYAGQTIRLTGALDQNGKVSGAAIVGMALITAGFTGKSATIPAGTSIMSTVLRDVTLDR